MLKRIIFRIFVNVLLIALTIPCLSDMINFSGDFYTHPGLNRCFEVECIINILIILTIFLKIFYNMKKDIGYFVLSLMIPISVFLLLNNIFILQPSIIIEGEAARSLWIRGYAFDMVLLIIQANLIISFVNSNKDCFKKKSGKILNNKE